jgi:hypothetical protein
MITLAFFSVPGVLVLLAVLLFLLPSTLVKRGASGLGRKLGRLVGSLGRTGTRPRQPYAFDLSAAALEEKYAKILGLKEPITPDAIKARWRELSKQYHPDQVHHLGPKLKAVAEREMKEINAAYDYLRKKYGA